MAASIPPGSYLTSGVDFQAREELETLDARVKSLEEIASDLGHALWGDSQLRNNGLRSRVRLHGKKLRRLHEAVGLVRKSWEDWRDIERPKTCIGVAELDKHLKDHDQMSARDVALEVAKIQAESSRRQAWKSMIGPVVVALIVLAGQVLLRP